MRPLAGPAPAIEQIRVNAHMREETRVLKHNADAPFARRHKNPPFAIEKRFAANSDATRSRANESGDRRKHGGFARSRRAEQSGHARGFAKLESRIEREIAEPVPQRHPGLHCPMSVRVRRATKSASTRPASASMMESAASRAAANSPPGA